MKLTVFPRVPKDARFPGWDGVRSLDGLLLSEAWEPEALGAVLRDGDYRLTCYTIPDESSIPRLNIPSVPVLDGMGAMPQAVIAVVDVDRDGHAAWASLSEATEHIEALLGDDDDDEGLLSTAAFYTTRAGYRLLWRLTTPVPVTKYAALVDHIMAELQDKHDIESDRSSREWTRLFRLPRCVRDGQVLPSYLDLSPLSEPLLDPYRWGALTEASADDYDAGDMPEPLDELDLDAWKATWRHPYIKQGRPFPPDDTGSTYPTMRRAIASVAHEGPVIDAEVLFSLVVRSVDATPGRTRGEAWKLCAWTAAKQRGAASRPPEPDPERPLTPAPPAAETWAEYHRTIDRRSAPTLHRLQAGLAFTPKGQAEDKLVSAIFSLGTKLKLRDPLALYSLFYASATASLVDAVKVWEQCVRVAGIVADEQDHVISDDEKRASVFCSETPLLVAVPGSGGLFMLDLRDKSAPTYQVTDKSCLSMHYNALLLGHTPFEVNFLDGKGRANAEDILRDYGNSATTIRYVTGQRGATFVPDAEGNALEIGVHSLHPSLQPVYHEQVHEWLTLFGGSDPERFLDWLAVATLTRFPVCAMYIHGLPGSGKSMLLQGLAAMWGGAPVPFAAVAADFNAGLLDSPIIAADEGIPPDKGDLSETFRNLVANSVHDVRIKYQANATLHGCLRLLITANELDALDFRKTLSGRSLQAIVERVAFIEQSDAPVRFLESLGGRRGTALWAERAPGVPGLIGEHLLWLRDDRKVEPTGRFLVSGVSTEWHRAFIGQQGIKPDVIKIIALAAKGAARLHGQQNVSGVEIRRDKRCVLITKEAIVSTWNTQGKGDTPRERILNKTLSQLDERVAVGLTRPRIGRNNPSAGTRAYALSFDTLAASQYVTLGLLTGKTDEPDDE